MKHCRKCGGALVDEARACIHCGVRLDEEGRASDAPNAAVALLAFFSRWPGWLCCFRLKPYVRFGRGPRGGAFTPRWRFMR